MNYCRNILLTHLLTLSSRTLSLLLKVAYCTSCKPVRSGKRTASAAVKIAVDMVQDRMITEREALMRIDAKNMYYFLHPMVDPRAVMYSGCRLIAVLMKTICRS